MPEEGEITHRSRPSFSSSVMPRRHDSESTAPAEIETAGQNHLKINKYIPSILAFPHFLINC